MIFIVGFPRSGTTLLQSLIMSDKSITSFPETHLYDLGIKRRGYKKLIPSALYLSYFCSKWFHKEYRTFKLFFSRNETKVRMAFFEAIKEQLLIDDDTCLLEKTPDHVHHLNTIRHDFPQAKVVHLIRHPDAAVASYKKAAQHWRGADTNEQTIYHKWLSSVLETKLQAEKHNDLVIYYEDILKNTSEVVEQLNNYLEIEINEQAFITNLTSNSQQIISKGEVWKENNLSGRLDTDKAQISSSGKLEQTISFFEHISSFSTKK